MGISRFKTLIAIAELGKFSDAAKSLYLTPAAVSQQMKALEAELDTPLFDRTKRPPELNPIGYSLIPKVKELVKSYDALKPSLAGEIETIEHLTVGCVPTIMSGVIPKSLSALQTKHQHLHTRIYPGLSDDLYAQVDRGFLDAAVLTQPPTIYAHLLWKPFTEEPLVVLASKDIESDDPRIILETQPFIRFTRRAWVGRMIDQWLLDNNIQVKEKMEIDTLESAGAMVMNNLGVSIVPMDCSATPGQGNLKAIPLGSSAPARVLGVLCRRDTSKHALVELLWQELIQIVEEIGSTKALRSV